ncbi:cupin domain protein [Xylaria sp. CBS 124048]|nr:cupin domain protein [Xylaria sp. CBS 124048]
MASGQGEASMPALPTPTRLITTTNPETGVATFDKSFAESLPVARQMGGTVFRLAYTSGRAPESLDGSDVAAYGARLESPPHLVTPGGGANVWYVDIPPGGAAPMHRTLSLDFIFLIEGELELVLDSGEARVLKAGDTVVQRSTNHAWKNLSKDKWVRFVAVMAESQPVVLRDGTKLGVAGLG